MKQHVPLSLAWLAGLTRRIRLGTTVLILPYRHDPRFAKLCEELKLPAPKD